MDDRRRGDREHDDGLGTHILLLRTRVALTQSALAELLGVHRRSVQNWETGVSYPKAETLRRLIAVFLRCRAFTAGSELAEAATLWARAAREGPHPLPAFDPAWFSLAPGAPAAIAAVRPPAADQREQAVGEAGHWPAAPEPAGQIIDWGEAIDTAPLYGREREVSALQRLLAEERPRVVAIIGLGGIGKSSLAIAVAHRLLGQFDTVLFRSLQNGPPLAGVLDQMIGAIAPGRGATPDALPEKIVRLVQLLRERRCLLILDSYEAIFQPSMLTGAYRAGYEGYGALLRALGEREHQSCLLLTSREKPAEIGPLEGRTSPVQVFGLDGVGDSACRSILEARDITGTADEDVSRLTHLYGGNPLAIQLVTEPIRELFGSDVAAFLAEGDAFLNGLGSLMAQQCARSTPLEHAILDWLAIEREPVPVQTLLAALADTASQRDVLLALESLSRRKQIERVPDRAAFMLQPVILDFVTSQLVGFVCQQAADGQPKILRSHALVQATATEHLRHSQERLIATPLLERLGRTLGGADAMEPWLLALLDSWREQPAAAQGYGPGNVVNLLRVLRGHLRGLNLSGLTIRQAYLQGVDSQDTSLAGSAVRSCVFTESFDALTAVAVSADGSCWAAAGRWGEIRLWSAGGQTLQQAWRAHADLTYALAFSPDGRTLASGSWDGTVKLWDVAGGALRWSGRHAGHVNGVAFAPDGATLASVGDDAAVRLWDAQSGDKLESLAQQAPAAAVAWSPREPLLAAGDLHGAIGLWRVRGSEPATRAALLAGHAGQVDGLAFAPDGGTLASASVDGTVRLWDVAGGRPPQVLAGHTGRVTRVAWSAEGRMLASGGHDQAIWLWDAEAGAYRATLRGHGAVVVGVAFTPGGALLSGSEDGTLRVWDIASSQCVRVLQGHASSLYDVDWSPDGARLASAGSDTLVTIFDAAGDAPPRVLRGHGGVVFGVAWSADGRRLASSEWDNAIHLWDPESGARSDTLSDGGDTGNFFYGVAWSPSGRRLAAGSYHHGPLLFEMDAHGARRSADAFPTFVRRVAWSPDGALLAGAGDDGSVYVWDAAQSGPPRQLDGHGGKVTSVAWSPDGRWLASAGGGPAGGELFVWDARSGARVWAAEQRTARTVAVAWGAGAGELISGDSDGQICWWDVASGTCVRVRNAHQGTVQSLRRSPDGARLASCGDDGAVTIWDLASGERLRTLRRDRPYERMDITGLAGITGAQRASLLALGATDRAPPTSESVV